MLVVQKYGGTSVADQDRIRAVADHVVRTRRQGNDVVVVVSAMGKIAIKAPNARTRVRGTRSGELDTLSPAPRSAWRTSR